MKKRGISAVLLAVLCGGCTHAKVTPLTNKDAIANSFVSFNAPSGGWYVYDNETWHTSGTGEIVNVYRKRPGSSYGIRVHTYPYSTLPFKGLFDREDDDLSRGEVPLNDNDREQGITYQRYWKTYVNGLRCHGTVFSRNFGGTAYQSMSKNYSIKCGYYDETEGKRLFLIHYNYNYALGDTRMQGDEGKSRSELLTQQQAEEGLKQGMRELVATLEIKNLDQARMDQEGLWFPGRPFDTSEF